MRNGQNKQRMRNRNNNNNNNRRGQNPMTRVYESNGPDLKIRGTASHIAEKYLQLARDSRSSGDPVAAENYYQHAEHYFRLIAAAQDQFRASQQPRGEDSGNDDNDDDGENFSNFGQEPGFVPAQNERSERTERSREHRDPNPPYAREYRPQPQFQPQPQNQPQPIIGDSGGVDRLPSFITGPQPQINGGGSFEGGGTERYPRRRRRPHGPRPEREAMPAPTGDDSSGD